MIYQEIVRHLPASSNLYLLLVVESKGSAPGRIGFKMLVDRKGPISGSIGGGVMEYNMVELAKRRLQSGDPVVFVKKQVHRIGQEDSSGMICSGAQTIAFMPILKADISRYEKVIEQLATSKPLLVQYTHKGIKFLPHDKNHVLQPYQKHENGWLYSEPLNDPSILYIIGGGHVGAATSQVFDLLGFKVIVLDNRSGLNTVKNNPYAHEALLADYDRILDYLPNNPQTHIVIMTTKFTEDQCILQQLATTDYQYIGVLGSKAKLAKMFRTLKDNGVPQSFLDRIHGPIGLSIGSQTPEEIAISIAAEVIQFSAGSR